ncbi:hypothetical protein [Streptomyces sp. NPDC054783]
MADNLARQLLVAHRADGELRPGTEIALSIDQIFPHDANGPLCALQLEAMDLDDVRAESAVAHVDHLMLEGDSRSAAAHAQ